MRFVDLFAGLGGFHVGLKKAGHDCVFACEIDDGLAKLYKKNFQLEARGDIRTIPVSNIPAHDILSAGFPCQPFSKAGKQVGLKDKIRGSLIEDVVRILNYHRPRFFILENVANLLNHNNQATWRHIKKLLKAAGYGVDAKILSPHQFGIPQHRQRLFIVGSRVGLDKFLWPQPQRNYKPSIEQILDKKPLNAEILSHRELECLAVWQEFLNRLPAKTKIPGFPIWAMEFGATYPHEAGPPALLSQKELAKCRGVFGRSLRHLSKKKQLELLPRYALGVKKFPAWKVAFIRQNRQFFVDNRRFIKPLLSSIKKFPFSWQKFEWNCHGEKKNIYKCIIQFRSSGIRVKRSNFAPTLVSASSTQIPIIGSQKRHMTKREAAKLQSLGRIRLPEKNTPAFRALGNAVNARIVYLIAKKLI